MDGHQLKEANRLNGAEKHKQKVRNRQPQLSLMHRE